MWLSPDTCGPSVPLPLLDGICNRILNEQRMRGFLLPMQVRLLHDGTVAAYVGIDASQRALQLAREACSQQSSSSSCTASVVRSPTATTTSATAAAAAATAAAATAAAATAGSCVHESLGSCLLVRRDCRLLSEELPLLQSRFILLVAGLDDLIARSTIDNADAQGPCDEALLQVLHSAAHALPIGGTLLLIEPT